MPLGIPIRAIQLERFGDPAAGRDEERNQGAIAQLLLVGAEGRRCGDPLELAGLEWLREPLRQLRQVDGDAEITRRPLLPGAEAEERPERNEPPVPRLRRQGLLATAAATRHRHLKFPEKIAVDVGELLNAGAAGEGPKAGEVGAVSLEPCAWPIGLVPYRTTLLALRCSRPCP